MRIDSDLIDEIVAHSRAEEPNECCGLIGGRDGVASSVHRARNAARSPLRYSVHPTDQFQIMERIEEAGEELIGIYHSHTRSPAWPSQTDVNLAELWPGTVQLICSLEDPGEPVVRAFSIDDREVEEVSLVVE